MGKSFHRYTEYELSHSIGASLCSNWISTNYLTQVETNDPNAGVREVYLTAFKNKLDALYYFYNLISDIYDNCFEEKYLSKLNEINNLISLIKLNKSDEDIDLSVVNFNFEDLSLNSYNDGYWIDSVKQILQQIIEDINIYFEIQYENESDDTLSQYDNLEFSLSSLKEFQIECQNLINFKNIFDPIFVEKFNKTCTYMNNFWNYWFE